MIQTVRVIQIEEKEDSKGIDILSQVKNAGVTKVRTAKVYRLEGIDRRKTKILAEKLFCEDINQTYSIDKPIFNGLSRKVEVAYKPGVMNPEVSSILKSAKDLGIKLLAADSSWEYNFFGKINQEKAGNIIESLRIFNSLIEYIVDKPPKTLLIKGRIGSTTTVLIRNISDESLMDLSKDKLFLNLEEMKVIQSHFMKIKRDPTDCELETLAQTWSEHCAHKTFKANLIIDGKKKKPLIDRIKKEALKHHKNIVSAFED